jgi:hypothetical protein
MQMAGDGEQVPQDRGQLDTIARRPQPQERFRRQVIRRSPATRQGERKAEDGWSVLPIEGLQVGHW